MPTPKSHYQVEKREQQYVCSENLRPAQAAQYTGLSESTLAKLRMRHKRAEGADFIKINGCVIYRKADLDVWMNSYLVQKNG